MKVTEGGAIVAFHFLRFKARVMTIIQFIVTSTTTHTTQAQPNVVAAE